VPKRSNKEEFLKKVFEKHPENKELYSYEKVTYISQDISVEIVCKRCGKNFLQTPRLHLRGCGCAFCNRGVSDIEEFIQKAKSIHGDKYDYSKIVYNGTESFITLTCHKKDEEGKEHGEFQTTPHMHITGKNQCPKCNTFDTKEFIRRARKAHGDKYDYSETKYTNIRSSVEIRCRKHGIFKQKAMYHLDGNGCQECSKEKLKEIGSEKRISKEEFIKRSFETHNEKYDYNKVEYIDFHKKVEIYCNKCKKYFWQTPSSHTHGSGCPTCKASKGEKAIEEFLKENSIEFMQQKKFDDCKGKKNKLPFDFYLPKQNVLIEYQGKQHYVPIERFGGIEALEKQKVTDNIKKEYCLKNNIFLFEITYLEKTDQRLSELLSIISPR
jgi:Zn finger protein HypA/HybF involved in hydrogenase expression